ncbi:MAG TPA: cell envelope integrity protein CreD [Rhodanobacteraceae bacterium]|nr:cell envelope integrity protein CreD [Rhodanobacteraceae bacterium]
MVARAFQGSTTKVLGIALLALLMLIPLAQVDGLVAERAGRAREASETIAQRWGAAQLIGPPMLVVPVVHEQVSERWIDAKHRVSETSRTETREYLLAGRAAIEAKLAPDVRSYGIYESVVYLADVAIEGNFDAADLASLAADGGIPQWDRAELRLPVADVRGIRRLSAVRLGGHESAFAAGTEAIGDVTTIGAAAPIDPASIGTAVPFSLSLTLAGTERFAALPLARDTRVHATSPWPNPGFDGAFLPAAHRVDGSGFEAKWQVLEVNRRFAQRWSGHESPGALAGSAFGITLTQPADTYQQNVRAGKYGVLFIALTFVAFFLFEVLRRLRVHPVQYLLIGLALCTFYVVLLALSEQIGFAPAYAVAAAAVALIVGGYSGAVFATRRAGAALGALLALIYALLYGLVVSEDYALLMGSLALLGAVAALMYLTRRVDWYALSTAPR